MEMNFWKDCEKNNGRASYWSFFDNKKLNPSEEAIKQLVYKMEENYKELCIPPPPKADLENLTGVLKGASSDILEALTRCCILTNTFVPIRLIAEGEWKNHFSYMQRFAMWRGAAFKGVFAYGKAFVEEVLEQEAPVVQELWEVHRQMQVKGFNLKNVYCESIKKSWTNPDKITLWNSGNVAAQSFREAVFTQWPDLKKMMNPYVRSHHKQRGLESQVLENCR